MAAAGGFDFMALAAFVAADPEEQAAVQNIAERQAAQGDDNMLQMPAVIQKLVAHDQPPRGSPPSDRVIMKMGALRFADAVLDYVRANSTAWTHTIGTTQQPVQAQSGLNHMSLRRSAPIGIQLGRDGVYHLAGWDFKFDGDGNSYVGFGVYKSRDKTKTLPRICAQEYIIKNGNEFFRLMQELGQGNAFPLQPNLRVDTSLRINSRNTQTGHVTGILAHLLEWNFNHGSVTHDLGTKRPDGTLYSAGLGRLLTDLYRDAPSTGERVACLAEVARCDTLLIKYRLPDAIFSDPNINLVQLIGDAAIAAAPVVDFFYRGQIWGLGVRQLLPANNWWQLRQDNARLYDQVKAAKDKKEKKRKAEFMAFFSGDKKGGGRGGGGAGGASGAASAAAAST